MYYDKLLNRVKWAMPQLVISRFEAVCITHEALTGMPRSNKVAGELSASIKMLMTTVMEASKMQAFRLIINDEQSILLYSNKVSQDDTWLNDLICRI